MPLTDKDETRLTSYDGSSRFARTFSNQEMEQALRDAAVEHQGALSRERYQAYYERTASVPHSYTIIRRYGKWNNALESAGLPVRKRSKYSARITTLDCIEALLVARDTLGHLPSVGEYTKLWESDEEDSLRAQAYPSASTIRMKFGRWRQANEEAARYIDKEICDNCGEPAEEEECEDCAVTESGT